MQYSVHGAAIKNNANNLVAYYTEVSISNSKELFNHSPKLLTWKYYGLSNTKITINNFECF